MSWQTDANLRINADTPEQIAAGLHGIGPELASRIVANREEVGLFKGPQELARVNGISMDKALLLSRKIDWTTPQHGQPKRRLWGAAIALVLLIVLVAVLRRSDFADAIPSAKQEIAGLQTGVGSRQP